MNELLKKWDLILSSLKDEYDISSASFETFIKPLKFYKMDNNIIYIYIDSTELDDLVYYIESKYKIPLKVTISDILEKDIEIEFLTKKNIKEDEDKKLTILLDEKNIVKFNRSYTFDTFVVGKNNQFAHAAALAVAESPGEIYNPLFLYGGVGLGKTHLMNAIANHITKNHPNKSVLYVTSETFTNEVIEAIRTGTSSKSSDITKLRDKYRNTDVLLIDDIQFVIGKERTQEEFFHTFNTLYNEKKAIIISSDRPPKEFESLEERIRTRFECGLMSDINPPDYETRMAILQKKKEKDYNNSETIPNEILEYIAENVTSNIRELEGSLTKVMAYAKLKNVELNLENAKASLSDIIFPKKLINPTPKDIGELVADHFNMDMELLKSSSRQANVTQARHLAIYLSRNYTTSTLQEIGQEFGGRNHSTVMNSINVVTEALSSNEKETTEVINKLLTLISTK